MLATISSLNRSGAFLPVRQEFCQPMVYSRSNRQQAAHSTVLPRWFRGNQRTAHNVLWKLARQAADAMQGGLTRDERGADQNVDVLALLGKQRLRHEV